MPFYYYPSYLLGGLLIYLGPAALLLYLAAWKKMKLTAPRCAKCQYDIRTCWDQPTCPECGRDIQKPGAVQFTDATIRKLPLTLAGIWLGAPVVMAIFGFAYSQTHGVEALPKMYTSAIIEGLADKQNIDAPWSWRELEQRYKNKELSGEQIERIFQILTKHLQSKKPNQRGPLHWSGDFIEMTLMDNRVSQSTMAAFLDTYYAIEYDIDYMTTERIFKHMEMKLRATNHFGLWNDAGNPSLLLTGIALDGQPPTPMTFRYADKQKEAMRNPGDPIPLLINHFREHLYFGPMLPAGQHTLILSIQCRYEKPLTTDIKQDAADRLLIQTQRQLRVGVTVTESGKCTVGQIVTSEPNTIPQTPSSPVAN